MNIGKDTVVTITYIVKDMDGKLLEESDEPVSYLHGGYDNIFPLVEQALEGKAVGDTVELKLQPADAFGEFDTPSELGTPGASGASVAICEPLCAIAAQRFAIPREKLAARVQSSP